MTSPIPRPPEPPVDDPGQRSLGCYEGYGSRDLSGFLMGVRDVIRFEWDRQRGAPPKDVVQQEVFLSQVMSAIQAGRVIPGFTRDAQTGQCVMDWAELACWARWCSTLYSDARDFVCDALSQGSVTPWEPQREYDWEAASCCPSMICPPKPLPCPSSPECNARCTGRPKPCDPNITPTDQVGCCPGDVAADPRYALAEGQYPGDQPLPTQSNVGIFVAVGLAAIVGVAALVLTSRSQA